MKIVATIEARTGSSRLPNKVMKEILGKPMLSRIIERIKRSEKTQEIVLATTELDSDIVLTEVAKDNQISFYRGSENDILSRLAGAIVFSGADILVSLTGDNPFIDPELIDDMLSYFIENDLDYLATTHMQHAKNWSAVRTFPTGVSVQVVRADLVKELEMKISDKDVRNLGLYCVYDDPEQRFKLASFDAYGKYADWNQPSLRMTVDTVQDFTMATKVYEALHQSKPDFSTEDAIRLLVERPEIRDINNQIKQRLGFEALD